MLNPDPLEKQNNPKDTSIGGVFYTHKKQKLFLRNEKDSLWRKLQKLSFEGKIILIIRKTGQHTSPKQEIQALYLSIEVQTILVEVKDHCSKEAISHIPRGKIRV